MKYQLENYRKFLLNRVTASQSIIDYIENVAGSEDESAKHTFHKVMVHNWSGSESDLFDTLCEYFNTTIIPVNYTSNQHIKTFYTCSLSFILRVMKLDFIFPYERSMFNLDVIFNDKTSADCFENRITIDDIVSGIVSNRLNDKFELDLSNFSEDAELLQKNIYFYKLSLLSHFKILMLRMGRDAKALNLSHNNLSIIPHEILNFFIKGDLIEVNLSHNNLKSLTQLQRMTSKIEKLWLEGNPLCDDDIEPNDYIKQVYVKFPRLRELDGVKLSANGILLPAYKNFIDVPDRKTKMATEKFLALYFTKFDSQSRTTVAEFYDTDSTLTFSTTCDDIFTRALPHLAHCITNMTQFRYSTFKVKPQKYCIKGRTNAMAFLCQLPGSIHQPSSFAVDVLKHDGKNMVIIVSGLCELKNEFMPLIHFRRTFFFNTKPFRNGNIIYLIKQELFSLSSPTEAQKELLKTFVPRRDLTTLKLLDPNPEEICSLCDTFIQLTQLKQPLAELMLKLNDWDIKKALAEFVQDLKSDRIPLDNFEDDEFSDLSSISDEID